MKRQRLVVRIESGCEHTRRLAQGQSVTTEQRQQFASAAQPDSAIVNILIRDTSATNDFQLTIKLEALTKKSSQ